LALLGKWLLDGGNNRRVGDWFDVPQVYLSDVTTSRNWPGVSPTRRVIFCLWIDMVPRTCQ
jgi:hypothetical protein